MIYVLSAKDEYGKTLFEVAFEDKPETLNKVIQENLKEFWDKYTDDECVDFGDFETIAQDIKIQGWAFVQDKYQELVINLKKVEMLWN